MAGRRDDRIRAPDAVETWVLDGDENSASGAPPQRAAHAPTGTARRVVIVAAAVAVFAFGVIVGRNSVTVESGSAQGIPTNSTSPATGISPAPAPVSSAAGSSAPTSRNTTTTPTAPRSDAATGTDSLPDDALPGDALPNDALPGDAWPTAAAACGARNPLPIVDSPLPLPEPVDLRVIAGGTPAPVDIASGTVGSPPLIADQEHYVADVATDLDETVLLIARCDGRGPGRVIRIPAGSAGTDNDGNDVQTPGTTSRISLVHGADRVWVAAPQQGAYGFAPIDLVAADGSGDTATLRTGVVPIGATGAMIIGQYYSGSTPSGRFGLIDTGTGAIVKEFGDEGSGIDAVNAFADGNYVISAPWVCQDACSVFRHTISTGEVHQVRLDPPTDRLLSTGQVAIRPDGGVAAVALFGQQPSPAPFDPSPAPSSQPEGVTRIGLIDLDSGRVRALPGLTTGPTQPPALAFSPDGKWLIVAVGAGDVTRLLLYTGDGEGPYDPHLTIPGPVLWPALALAAP